MTGRMITGGVVEIIEVNKGRDSATETILKENIIRWRNNDEKDYGGYRGSSSRRKPWDGDLDY